MIFITYQGCQPLANIHGEIIQETKLKTYAAAFLALPSSMYQEWAAPWTAAYKPLSALAVGATGWGSWSCPFLARLVK